MRPHVPGWTNILSNSKKRCLIDFLLSKLMFGGPIIPFDLRRYFCFIIKLFQNLWHQVPCLYPLNLTSTLNTGRCLGSNTSSAFHSRSIWTQSQTFTEYRQYLCAIPCDFFSVLSFFINVEYHWRKRIDILKDGLLPPLFVFSLPQNKQSISPQK